MIKINPNGSSTQHTGSSDSTTTTSDITQLKTMREVVNPIAGKEYFYRTKDEFDDDEFTKGILIIHTVSEKSENPYVGWISHTLYSINGVNVAHNIWLQKKSKPPEWAIMREVVNPIAGKEYFYRTKDEFDDDEFTKGILIIQTLSEKSENPYVGWISHTLYSINGVNVAHNIWLPKK
jgi:hypothetical protein